MLMEKPIFNNRPNDRVSYAFTSEASGVKIRQDYFISRAVAVVGVVFAIPLIGGMHVLTTKRSKRMRDEPNKHCVPCGYLDFDETLYDGMIREVFEETSLYLPNYQDLCVFDNNKQPYQIKDSPSDNRQNVSMLYMTVLDFSANMDRFPTEIEMHFGNETQEVKWLPLIDLYANKVDWEWAFHHDETIKTASDYYLKHLQSKQC